MAEQVVVTKEGFEKLQNELEYLKTVRRKEVVEAIRAALAFGDLSENSEYDEAKNEQGKVEGRITELEEMLRDIKVVDDVDVTSGIVNVGAKVKVFDEEMGEEFEYKIVGSSEANPAEGKISDQSPVGTALIGAKVGETVVALTPGGELKFKVLAISK